MLICSHPHPLHIPVPFEELLSCTPPRTSEKTDFPCCKMLRGVSIWNGYLNFWTFFGNGERETVMMRACASKFGTQVAVLNKKHWGGR
uniref:Uncharacterized protein n=1 Tax=Varanus komodoensis TaxID=61221 RepID=A0A8D2LDE6_VARKO